MTMISNGKINWISWDNIKSKWGNKKKKKNLIKTK